MSPRTLFTNARLLDPASGLDRKGELLSVDGRIAQIGEKLSRSERTVGRLLQKIRTRLTDELSVE